MTDQSTLTAHWRFAIEVITPIIGRRLPEPTRKVAVELDPRGEELLAGARSFFAEASGVETQDGKIPLPDASANLIYSVESLWNAPDIKTFESLIRECGRVLEPGGVAMLWYGRITKWPFALQPQHWLRGWDGPGSTAPGAAIRVRSSLARRIAIRAGIKAVALSTPLHPDVSWRLFRGGPRSYITCWKRN